LIMTTLYTLVAKEPIDDVMLTRSKKMVEWISTTTTWGSMWPSVAGNDFEIWTLGGRPDVVVGRSK
jgi:hypothetical protein